MTDANALRSQLEGALLSPMGVEDIMSDPGFYIGKQALRDRLPGMAMIEVAEGSITVSDGRNSATVHIGHA